MEVPSSKTRDKLIEEARLLFAKKGVENTTMNDIAQISKKGRRTLYTYFKSKKEIYGAVIKSELDRLYTCLDEVVSRNVPANEKLIEFIDVRLRIIKEVVTRNGTLKANFFRDIWRVENVRKEFDQQEIKYIQKILDEGVEEQIMVIEDTRVVAEVLHYSFKGLEVPYIRGIILEVTDENAKKIKMIVSMIFNGILKKD